MFRNNRSGSYIGEHKTHEYVKGVVQHTISDIGRVAIKPATHSAGLTADTPLNLSTGSITRKGGLSVSVVHPTDNVVTLPHGHVYHIHGLIYAKGTASAGTQYRVQHSYDATSWAAGTASWSDMQACFSNVNSTNGVYGAAKFDYVLDLTPEAQPSNANKDVHWRVVEMGSLASTNELDETKTHIFIEIKAHT